MIKSYAAFEPKGELKPFEYDPGELKPLEVEIDVHYCGICHSDLSVIDSEWGKSAYPVVAGHEVVGKISQVGSHVKDLANIQGQTTVYFELAGFAHFGSDDVYV